MQRGPVDAFAVPVRVTVVDEGQGPAAFTVAPNPIRLRGKPGEVLTFRVRVSATSVCCQTMEVATDFEPFTTADGQPTRVVADAQFPGGKKLRPNGVLEIVGNLIVPKNRGIYSSHVSLRGEKHGQVQIPIELSAE